MKYAFRYLLIIFGMVSLQTACKESPKKVVKTEPITFSKEGTLELYKADTDSLITRLDIEIAETEYETQTGLMYRDAMAENQGMLFIFPDEAMHSFYMKNTKIALDIIYIDSDLRIASFQENAVPMDENSLPSQVPVQYVLEINAGLSQKWLLEVGDRISYKKD